MARCWVCEEYPERLAEVIAHEVLAWIAEKEGYDRVIHSRPNGPRDRQGKDFIIVPKGKRSGIGIQIKAFRILEDSVLQPKLERFKKGMRLRRGHSMQVNTVEKLRAFMLELHRKSRKLGLLANDAWHRREFEIAAKRGKLARVLRCEKEYDALLAAYGAYEQYFNLFEKEIRHVQLHPDVRVFLLVDTTHSTDLCKQIPALKHQWLLLLREAIARKADS